jgi:hypothetical protein
VLHQITYISSARPTVLLADVEGILETSRRRNRQDEITGLLVFDGKRFLQVIEGPYQAIETTFARIAKDPRHRALVKLATRSVEAREFGHWAMASHIVGLLIGDGNIVAQVDALTETLTDPNIKATLRGFARVRA